MATLRDDVVAASLRGRRSSSGTSTHEIKKLAESSTKQRTGRPAVVRDRVAWHGMTSSSSSTARPSSITTAKDSRAAPGDSSGESPSRDDGPRTASGAHGPTQVRCLGSAERHLPRVPRAAIRASPSRPPRPASSIRAVVIPSAPRGRPPHSPDPRRDPLRACGPDNHPMTDDTRARSAGWPRHSVEPGRPGWPLPTSAMLDPPGSRSCHITGSRGGDPLRRHRRPGAAAPSTAGTRSSTGAPHRRGGACFARAHRVAGGSFRRLYDGQALLAMALDVTATAA